MDKEKIRNKYLRKRKLSDIDFFSMMMELFIDFVSTQQEQNKYLFTQEEIDKAKNKTDDLNHAELLYVSMIELHNKRTSALHQFYHGYWRAKCGFLMSVREPEVGVGNIKFGRSQIVKGLKLLQACDICLSIFCDVYKTKSIYDRLKVDFPHIQLMLNAIMELSMNKEIQAHLNGYKFEPVEITKVDKNSPILNDIKSGFQSAKKNKNVLRLELKISKIQKGVL